MIERQLISQKAQNFFEDLWKRGDHWKLESSEFEQTKYARLFAMVDERRYGRVLEIGCGIGRFTRLLARISDWVVAVDIAPTAITRARAVETDRGRVDFHVANIMDYDPCAEGPWDLVVMNETIYYLGWLYSFFDISWLASELLNATRTTGRFLMANTQGLEPLLSPWIIRTYRDLFLNVGYTLEAEETFRGIKDGVDIEVLISLFTKSGCGDG